MAVAGELARELIAVGGVEPLSDYVPVEDAQPEFAGAGGDCSLLAGHEQRVAEAAAALPFEHGELRQPSHVRVPRTEECGSRREPQPTDALARFRRTGAEESVSGVPQPIGQELAESLARRADGVLGVDFAR